jgi:SAM-dependent methyltransferase
VSAMQLQEGMPCQPCSRAHHSKSPVGITCWRELETGMEFPLHHLNHRRHLRGDHKLRSTYGERMLQLMSQLGCAAPSQVGKVLDMGCATGLSSLALRELFPAAHITGVDLSPHFLAVAGYEQQKRCVGAGCLPVRMNASVPLQPDSPRGGAC